MIEWVGLEELGHGAVRGAPTAMKGSEVVAAEGVCCSSSNGCQAVLGNSRGAQPGQGGHHLLQRRRGPTVGCTAAPRLQLPKLPGLAVSGPVGLGGGVQG